MKLVTLFAALALAALTAGCASSPLQRGNAAFLDGNYAEAERIWGGLAADGDPFAQYNLGILYEQRRDGLVPDYDRAARWYTKSLSQGYVPAMVRLADLHRFRENREKAVYFYTLAARWGNDEAAAALEELEAPAPEADLYRAALERQRSLRRHSILAAHDPRRPNASERHRMTQDDYYWTLLQQNDGPGN